MASSRAVGLGVGHHDVGRHADVGLAELGGRPERGPVAVHRLEHGGRADVVVRREAQAVGARPPRRSRRRCCPGSRPAAPRPRRAPRGPPPPRGSGRCRRSGRARRRPARCSSAAPRAAAAAAVFCSANRGEPSSGLMSNRGGMSSPFGVRPSDHGGRGAAADQRGGLGFARPAAGAAQAEVEAPRVQGVEQAELLDRGQGGAMPHLHRPGAEPDRATSRRRSAPAPRPGRCRPRRG